MGVIVNQMFCLTLLVACLNVSTPVEARGRMMDPPQRGSMFRAGFTNVPANWNDMSENVCGMIKQQWDEEHNCGVCGDPLDAEVKQHEPPSGKFATGTIGKVYESGQEVEVTIDITANHKGFFEFRLCANDEPMAVVNQTCFDEHMLPVLNGNESGLPIPTDSDLIFDASKNGFKYFLPPQIVKKYKPVVQLPEGVKCNACIFQWRYRAGNASGKKQEEIFNCADVQIV